MFPDDLNLSFLLRLSACDARGLYESKDRTHRNFICAAAQNDLKTRLLLIVFTFSTGIKSSFHFVIVVNIALFTCSR